MAPAIFGWTGFTIADAIRLISAFLAIDPSRSKTQKLLLGIHPAGIGFYMSRTVMMMTMIMIVVTMTAILCSYLVVHPTNTR